MPYIKQDWRRWLPSLTWQPNPQVARVVAELPDQGILVDLGAGGRLVSSRAITIDRLPLPNTRLVADVHALPLADGSVDLVIATGLLEHVEDADRCLMEMRRILKPGGRLHLEFPFLTQYHADPIDLRRFTLPGLIAWLQRHGFQVVVAAPLIGPTTTILTLLAYYAALWWEGESRVSKWFSNGVFLFCALCFYPFKFLDFFLIHKKNAHRLAFAVFATAVKV